MYNFVYIMSPLFYPPLCEFGRQFVRLSAMTNFMEISGQTSLALLYVHLLFQKLTRKAVFHLA